MALCHARAPSRQPVCAAVCLVAVSLAACAGPRRGSEDPETGAPEYDPLTAGTLAFEREPQGEPRKARPGRTRTKPAPSGGAQAFATDLVVYDGKSVRLKARIGFDEDNLLIDETGRAILEDVVWLLQETPGITKIEVQSHADPGLLTPGEKVTQRRADLVRDYLVGSGIDSKRVTAVGYEDTMPVGTNRTDEGQAANTRIELVVRGVVGQPVSRRPPAQP
jgi:outer membrane protein OmpA-like peptidoglycan-associated protein